MVTLEVPPGTWAVQAFHDEAQKGQVTYNMFGMPDGGIGFSNDPPFRFQAAVHTGTRCSGWDRWAGGSA